MAASSAGVPAAIPAACITQSLPPHPLFRLFGEVDATQQTLEAGVGTKWVESRIHFQVA
jgi:hypothetical protein